MDVLLDRLILRFILILSDETKLDDILQKSDLETFAKIVSELKNSHSSSVSQVICHNKSCPGIINRSADKEKSREKRNAVVLSRSELANEKYHKRTSKRDLGLNSKEDEFMCMKRKKIRSDTVRTTIWPADISVSEQTKQGNDNTQQVSFLSGPSNLCKINFDCKKASSDLGRCKYPLSESGSRTSPDTFDSPRTDENCSNMKQKDAMDRHHFCIDKAESKEGSTGISRFPGKLRNLVAGNTLATTFRVSCRIRGRHKGLLSSEHLTRSFIQKLESLKGNWVVNWAKPDLDFYLNLTDLHFLIGKFCGNLS